MSSGKKKPRILRDGERDQFLSAFSTRGESPPRYKTRHRDQMMCRLMLEAGLRVAEVAALRPEHFDSSDCRLMVRAGKGAKDRELGLGWDLCQDLSEWLARREEEYPDTEWIFPTSNGTKVATSHLRRRVKRAARDAGLREAERVHPHVLRHTFSVHMRENGATLEEVQEMLGHEHLSTTEKYLRGLDASHVEAMQEIQNGSEEQPEQEQSEDAAEILEEIDAKMQELGRLKARYQEIAGSV